MKKTLLYLLILPFLSFSQNFSEEDYVYLKRQEHIDIRLENHKFDITKTFFEQAQFQSSNKLYFANESMMFDSFTSIEDIEAYTYLPDLDKRIDVDYIENKRVFDNGIFYSDQELKSFVFPAVKKGAITTLSYKKIIKDPHFLGMFRFGTFVPTKKAVMSIEFPNNVTIGYIGFNTENTNITFKEDKQKNSTIYTWTAENIEGYQTEGDSESSIYYLPHIIVYIKNYTSEGNVINVLNDASDLYKWYSSLVNQISEDNLESVYKIADQITKDKSSKRDKAEAIFNWVQNNITYVAFEDGLGGFIPRGASSVCSKRYGDCKDMANVLYEMLNHVGIEAYRAWIGTRDRPYSYHEVPTPIVDNHMITAVVLDGETIFLDATDSYVPFGMPSSFIQGKEAMIGIDKDHFKLETVAIQTPEQSKTIVKSVFKLKDKKLLVNETREMTGYDKVDFITKHNFEKDNKTDEEFLNTTLSLGNNKTKYNNIKKSYFDNSQMPLRISYDLDIENYAKSIGNKLYINLNIDKTLSKSRIETKERKFSKKIDHKYQKEFTTIFEIPQGYKINHIPEDLKFDHKDYSYHITYEVDNNSIIQHKVLRLNTLSIQNKDFESWNTFVKSLIKAYKKSIILEQQ